MNIKLSTRLVSSHLCLGIIPLLFISALFWIIASSVLEKAGQQGITAVEKAAHKQLQTMCQIKKKQLGSLFQTMEGQLHVLKGTPWIREATQSLNKASKGAGRAVDSRVPQLLTKEYDLLFKDICANLDWQDIFLISPEGEILYSMSNKGDLGLSLSREPLMHSSLGRAFAEIRSNKDQEVAFGDFSPYAVPQNTPAAFLITRIKDQQVLNGYIALQISNDAIRRVMEPASDKKHFLEAYLVGPDGYMRSDSIISPEQYSIIASFRYDNKVNTAATRNALDGKNGSGIIQDYNGTTVLSSWAPVDVFNTRWALICEIDETEAMQGKTAMQETMAWAVRKMSFCSLVVLITIVTIMGFVSWCIARSVTEPIKNAARVANLIASGDFTQRLKLKRSDEVGLMAEALDHMAERVSKNLRHKTGIAELSNRMREEDQLVLADNIVSYLAGYLDAQMAALYLTEEDTEQLVLIGTYAADKAPTRIKFGQGLVGQAAREQRMLSITDLPDDYIAISSSLGNSTPHSILAAPFVHDNKLMGVLEFASFTNFSVDDKEFLNDVLHSIAAVFDSARSRRIQELLKQTQQQTKELHQHTEELRVTNEELAAQTVELQIVQERLEANNQVLSEKTELLEVQKKEIAQRNTELLKTKEKLEKQSKELALASKYKSEFLANMSHELRTPMNSLLLLAQALQENREKNLTENQQKSAEFIVDSGKELLNIIDEILDLAFIEAGRVKKQIQEVVLADVAENMQNLFIHMAAAKGLAFRVSVDPALPPTMFTDRTRLEQILKNFIGNSLKFTKQGEVSVVFARAPKDVEFRSEALVPAEAIAISVADTGIGIPAEKQEAIFEAFQQADGSTARKYGGTGLGLSISKQLAALLGGEIHLRSTPGKRSVFTLYLPLHNQGCEKEQSQIQDEQTENDQENKQENELEYRFGDNRISVNAPVEQEDFDKALSCAESLTHGPIKKLLVVEDDDRMRSILLDLVGNRDTETLEAKTGLEAREVLQTQAVDCMVLDLGLPDYNGVDLLRELSEEVGIAVPPVIVYTGRILTKEEVRELNKYSESIILKNAWSGERLKDETSMFLQQEPVQITDAVPEPPEENVAALKDKKILLVDDDMRNIFALSSALKTAGMEVSIAENGRMALSMLAQHPDLDIILMDIMMPEMDGYTTIGKIRESQEVCNLPIIALTAKAMKGDREKCLEAGADSYLAKPVDMQELFAVMQQVLSQKA